MIELGRVQCKCSSDNIQYEEFQGEAIGQLECLDCDRRWRPNRRETLKINAMIQAKRRKQSLKERRDENVERKDDD